MALEGIRLAHINGGSSGAMTQRRDNKIEYNVPIPEAQDKKGYTTALRRMQPGAFVRLPAKMDNVRSLVYTLRKRGELAGLKFTMRQLPEGGVGVWCLADGEPAATANS